MKNKNYTGLNSENDISLLDEIISEMYDGGDGICGIDEIVSVICGNEFYGNWDSEDLEYVKEVMREFRGVIVEFNEDESFMSIEGEVDEDEE
jgi:hypothetical protein